MLINKFIKKVAEKQDFDVMTNCLLVSSVEELRTGMRDTRSDNPDDRAKGKKRVKTDKRDAKNIAKYLACHTCSPGHISTEEDEPVYEAFVKAESLLLLILCE